MKANVEAERVRMQLTKAEAAARLCVSAKTYGEYIREKRPIPSYVLVRMSRLFGCSTDYLLPESHVLEPGEDDGPRRPV